MNDPTASQPDPRPASDWQVFLHGEHGDVTSYIVRAEDELTAAATAGQEHDEDDRIHGVDVEPWSGS